MNLNMSIPFTIKTHEVNLSFTNSNNISLSISPIDIIKANQYKKHIYCMEYIAKNKKPKQITKNLKEENYIMIHIQFNGCHGFSFTSTRRQTHVFQFSVSIIPPLP